MTKKTTRRDGVNAPALPSHRRCMAAADRAKIRSIDRLTLIAATKVIYRVVFESMRHQKPMVVRDRSTGLPLSRAEVRRRFNRGWARTRCGLFVANGRA